jgi:catechol 2,3-dioxygenase-like lactoylglutathione lyase family enzyme
MPEIVAVVETGIYVDDLDRAETFYRDVLGLALIGKEPGRHVFFRVGTLDHPIPKSPMHPFVLERLHRPDDAFDGRGGHYGFIEQGEAVPRMLAFGVRRNKARWPMAKYGSVPTPISPGSLNLIEVRLVSLRCSRVVQFWPVALTYCRSSWQMGQEGGGCSVPAYCVPEVVKMKFVIAHHPLGNPHTPGVTSSTKFPAGSRK